MKEFERYQASLIGISPGAVTVQTLTKDTLELVYIILSDVGNKVAAKYGLSYRLGNELAAALQGMGIDLANNLGTLPGEEPEMPIPATFVIDTNRRIAFAFSDFDHTKRAEPADIVASLISISP